MQRAQVVHHLPGRLRLRIPSAKRNGDLLLRIRESIRATGYVTEVEVNPQTGSVLVFYESRDPDAFLRDLRERGIRERLLDIELPVHENQTADATRASVGPGLLRKFAGRSMLVFGAAGVVLPVVPGIPFVLAGAALLGPKDPIISRSLTWVRRVATMIRRSTSRRP